MGGTRFLLGSAFLSAVGAIATASLVASCSAGSNGDGTDPFATGGSTGAGSASGSGSATGSGSTLGGGGGLNLFGDATIGSGGSLGGQDACASDTHAGERSPLDMYFLVDTSGSMNQDSKWQNVSTALVGFLNDPNSADIGVGIGYFPAVSPNAPSSCQDLTNSSDCKNQYGDFGTCQGGVPIIGGCSFFGLPACFCSGADVCQPSAYAAPSVPLQLPPNHAAVVADLATHSPTGGTPTRPALEGAMQYAEQWAAANPGRATVVVLATDGQPTGCTTNTPQDVANIATAGLQKNIKTFVIGVGSSLNNLNLVAQAGGTDHAYIVDTGGDVAKQFSDALAAIHGQAASCTFTIPKETNGGQAIDPHMVNISVMPPGAASSSVLGPTQDMTAATCSAAGGWYYDNPGAPTSITLCDASCQNIKTGGSVSVEYGCPTAPPVLN